MDWLTGQSWHVRRELRNWLKSAPHNAHVLDAGTGYGHQAYWLSQRHHNLSVLAIDSSTEHVARGNAYARERGRENLFFKTALLDEYVASEAFDLILCTDAIASVANERHVLGNLRDALRENGLMVATVARRKSDIPAARPAYGYEMAELKQLLKECGFRKVKAHYTGGRAGQVARALGVTTPLALLRFSRLFAAIMPFYYLLTIPVVVTLNWLDSRTAQRSGKGILVLARK